MKTAFTKNSETIEECLHYLKSLISYRLKLELNNEEVEFPEFQVHENDSYLFKYIKEKCLSAEEIIFLTLALIPKLLPHFLEDIMQDHLPEGGDFTEFGGVKGKNHRGIIPTGETALYILFGNDLNGRLAGIDYIKGSSTLFKNGILSLESLNENEPEMSGKIKIEDEFADLITLSKLTRPEFSTKFPAQLVETNMEWEDLVLSTKTMDKVLEVKLWLDNQHTLMEEWGMNKTVKPGYKCLFHGPPGTGKTLTVGLLGKLTGRDVYKVDLSMIVSKYIGETEKNLSSLFAKAENKDWILFFDEADSLFGKRTEVKDSNDRFANQEVSYLLQRIESYAGLVVLASNFKNNLDKAFSRRFQSFIPFANPNVKERLQLWENTVPQNASLEPSIDLRELAQKHEITGANIVNVIQYASLQAIGRKSTTLLKEDLIHGIRNEYLKEERL